MSMQPYVSNASMYNPMFTTAPSTSSSNGMYGGNPHVDIMQYPVSSSDANSLNKSTPIPHIQSAPPSTTATTTTTTTTTDDSSGGDPNSTLNFINDLKAMLKSTDRLLQNKPMSLYESSARV